MLSEANGMPKAVVQAPTRITLSVSGNPIIDTYTIIV